MGQPKKFRPMLWLFILLLIGIFLLIYMIGNSRWWKRKQYPMAYEDQIRKYASEYEVDPFLVVSVIWVESRFIPTAVSSKDARGLMQILPSTGEWVAEKIGLSGYSDEQLFEPEINIQIGCWYLGYLTSQFPDSRKLVLASYNGGIGNVNKWLSNKEYSPDGKQLDHIPFAETRSYVKKVTSVYEIYKEIYPSWKSRTIDE
jgi:soluble lytic murein transglycosylase